MIWLLLLLAAPLLGQQDKAGLSGTVFNAATGEPVRKARLTLRLNSTAAEAPPPVTVGTDDAGKFEFVDIAPGAYRLLARRDGFAQVELGARARDAVLLGPGDRKTEFQVKLVPHGVIAGVITEPDGDPVRNMPVNLMLYRYTTRGRELAEGRGASTNDLGEYRIFDVPPGKYFIRASPGRMRVGSGPEDTEFYSTAFYPGAPDAAGARQIELAAGQQLTGFNFLMRRARYATIRGRVVTPPGATDVHAGRMFTDDRGTSSSTGRVEADGKFEFFGVAPGLIYLVASYVLDGQRYTAQLPVQVGSEDIDGIELRPAPPVEVSGRVRIEGGSEKPSSVGLELLGPGRRYGAESSLIKDDGALTFRGVERNSYRVAPSRMGNLYLKSVYWGQTDITESELDLTAGVPPRTELTVTFGGDSGQLEGVVRDDKQQPVESAVVTLLPAIRRNGPFHKSATADRSGKFRIQGVAPGAYRVFAWEKVDVNAVIYDPDFLRPHEGAGVSLQVAAGEQKRVELRAIAAGN
jgi:hypothetical protein